MLRIDNADPDDYENTTARFDAVVWEAEPTVVLGFTTMRRRDEYRLTRTEWEARVRQIQTAFDAADQARRPSPQD